MEMIGPQATQHTNSPTASSRRASGRIVRPYSVTAPGDAVTRNGHGGHAAPKSFVIHAAILLAVTVVGLGGLIVGMPTTSTGSEHRIAEYISQPGGTPDSPLFSWIDRRQPEYRD